jgi:hypothetical protein
MTFDQPATMPDGTPVTVRSTWTKFRGTPGTLSDAPGWELQELWILRHPCATHDERRHVEAQLTPPDQ